jgi:hypothetical protein
MQTRSQTKYQTLNTNNLSKTLYPPFTDVDFDEASKAWKANKKSIGNGCYKYVCSKITKTGKQCKNDSLRGCEYCRFHINK